MDDMDCIALKQILSDLTLAVPEKVEGFIRLFNGDAGPGDPVVWNVSKEEWQRFEFLGDRVLNLVAAELLYSRSPPCREGEMTRKMGVVSNESLAAIAECLDLDLSLLIPSAIGRQQAYGDAVKGGAVEACIGAIYASAGFEATRAFVCEVLEGEVDRYDPSANFIGRLQEHFQQLGEPLPVYRELSRTGPPHQPVFTCGIYNAGEALLGKGTGRTTTEARQAAAKQALEVQSHP
jgi:ribonuclease-3